MLLGQYTNAVTAAYFGLSHLGVQTQPWPTVDYTIARMWDTNAQHTISFAYGTPDWRTLHTSIATFDWNLFDTILNALVSHGKTEILYTFGRTPNWVSGDSAFYAAWTEFVTAIVSRAGSRITAWGIRNEPLDGLVGDHLDSTHLAAMAVIAYPIIKAANPAALVLSPEYQGNEVSSFVEFCNLGGLACFDVIGLHSYTLPDHNLTIEAGNTFLIMESYLAAKSSLGISNRPIWITEFSDDGFNNYGGTANENERDYISQMFPTLRSYGVERIIWYANDGNTGNLSGVGNVAATGWTTMRTGLLNKTVPSPVQHNGQVNWIDLLGPSGYHGRIVWQYKGTSSYAIPAAYYTRKYLMDGSSSVISGGTTSVTVGNTAILLDNT